MTTVFIIVEHGWRYNDEYYRPEGMHRIEPVCYTTKEEADEVCKNLNEKQRKYYSEYDCFYDEEGQTKEEVEFCQVIPLQLN